MHVEIAQFFLKFLWKLKILAVYHYFYWLLVATKLFRAKLDSCYAKECIGVENLEKPESDSDI